MRKFFTLLLHVNTYYSQSQTSDFKSSLRGVTGNNELVKAPEQCVKNILDFAHSYRVAESKSAGKIEMVLN